MTGKARGKEEEEQGENTVMENGDKLGRIQSFDQYGSGPYLKPVHIGSLSPTQQVDSRNTRRKMATLNQNHASRVP